jgi:hypothetical protein
MNHAYLAFIDIRKDRAHEFPDFTTWILSSDPECVAFRQGWAARSKRKYQ